MKLLGAILASLTLGATGGYVLWQFHTGWGLLAGLTCILLMLCIAFPANIQPGIETLKLNITVIAPVVKQALGLPGGQRVDDPTADGTPKDGAS
jgi:hypothetical protein